MVAAVVQRPEQREGERHGQDLRHADRNPQETQNLQRLGSPDEAVDLRTAALKHKQEAVIG